MFTKNRESSSFRQQNSLSSMASPVRMLNRQSNTNMRISEGRRETLKPRRYNESSGTKSSSNDLVIHQQTLKFLQDHYGNSSIDMNSQISTDSFLNELFNDYSDLWESQSVKPIVDHFVEKIKLIFGKSVLVQQIVEYTQSDGMIGFILRIFKEISQESEQESVKLTDEMRNSQEMSEDRISLGMNSGAIKMSRVEELKSILSLYMQDMYQTMQKQIFVKAENTLRRANQKLRTTEVLLQKSNLNMASYMQKENSYENKIYELEEKVKEYEQKMKEYEKKQKQSEQEKTKLRLQMKESEERLMELSISNQNADNELKKLKQQKQKYQNILLSRISQNVSFIDKKHESRQDLKENSFILNQIRDFQPKEATSFYHIPTENKSTPVKSQANTTMINHQQRVQQSPIIMRPPSYVPINRPLTPSKTHNVVTFQNTGNVVQIPSNAYMTHSPYRIR